MHAFSISKRDCLYFIYIRQAITSIITRITDCWPETARLEPAGQIAGGEGGADPAGGSTLPK